MAETLSSDTGEQTGSIEMRKPRLFTPWTYPPKPPQPTGSLPANFRPDFSQDQAPLGITDVYVPGRDRHVELTPQHIFFAKALVAAEAGNGGLSAAGNFVSTDNETVTAQQHHEKVIAARHIEAQQA